jgi:hypothetical protein
MPEVDPGEGIKPRTKSSRMVTLWEDKILRRENSAELSMESSSMCKASLSSEVLDWALGRKELSEGVLDCD